MNTQINNELVNLGLPSGTKWMKYNLDAKPGSTPESWYGKLFAWGEVEGVERGERDFTWRRYRHGSNYKDISKYNETDQKLSLDAQDDAIIAAYGAPYHMPTVDQCKELIEHTSHCRISDYNGVKGLDGILFVSQKGGEIFFPFTGYDCHGVVTTVPRACIWTSDLLDPERPDDLYYPEAQYLDIYIEDHQTLCIEVIYAARFCGHSIRGVQDVQ